MMEMLNLQEALKFTAILAGGVMSGTAIYISVVEVPSRRKLPIKAMREQWEDSFNRAAPFVLSIGSVQTLATITLYFIDKSDLRCLWLIDPCVFLFGGLYTTLVMLPEIGELKNKEIVEKKGDKWVEEAVNRWAKRHFARTLINLCGFGCVVYASLKV